MTRKNPSTWRVPACLIEFLCSAKCQISETCGPCLTMETEGSMLNVFMALPKQEGEAGGGEIQEDEADYEYYYEEGSGSGEGSGDDGACRLTGPRLVSLLMPHVMKMLGMPALQCWV